MANKLLTPEFSFGSMSWNPDIPAYMLGENEYNNGANIEADLRTIRKLSGEEEIFDTIPGTPIYHIGVNKDRNVFAFLVATREGRWYEVDQNGVRNITPGFSNNPNVALGGYSDSLNITDSEVGGVVFINDTLRPPMFYRPTDTEIQVFDSSPSFVWNYEQSLGVLGITAEFIRAYASPHGNVLVAGNLIKTFAGGVVQRFAATVRWSNLFALGTVPTSWEITNETFGNEVDVPVRGPIIDGFHFQGNFYVCSYWDTAALYPLAFQTTLDTIFGIKLVNTGRGLFANNSWVNTDQIVYGFDSRDIWKFDGQGFTSLGNQQVKEFLYRNLSANVGDRMFIINNTRKNQIEIYYPDLSSSSWCNKMISYRYDLSIWNPPRDVANAALAQEGPVRENDTWVESERSVYYIRGGDTATDRSKIIRKDVETSDVFIDPQTGGTRTINAFFEKSYFTIPQIPYWQKMLFHRLFPKMQGAGSVTFELGGSQSDGTPTLYTPPTELALTTDKPWVQANQNELRTLAIRISSGQNASSWNIGSATLQVSQVTSDI